MGVLLIVSVCPLFAAVNAVQTFTDSTWSNEIYYIASLSGEYGKTTGQVYGYGDVTISMTAIDEYTLYVNGTKIDSTMATSPDYPWEIGADKDWEKPAVYIVNVDGDVINIGVKVKNHGQGSGNGLIMSVQAGTDRFGTSTVIRKSIKVSGQLQDIPAEWWTFDSEQMEDLGLTEDDWFDFSESFFDNVSQTKLMSRALEGEMGDIDFSFGQDSDGKQFQVISGYLNTDADIGASEGGGITLRRIEGENIALEKPSYKTELTDGDLITGFSFSSNPIDTPHSVDLERIYRVNKLSLYTGGKTSDFEKYAVMGFKVQISMDEYRWEEVGIIHEIGLADGDGNVNEGGLDNYSVDFPAEWARYLKYTILEHRGGTTYPKIGEIMVFGEGYIYEASYESPWLDFDSPATYKNFDVISWNAQIPDGTEVSIQTQTKNGVDGNPSVWSAAATTSLKGNVSSSFRCESPEPATHIRYRVLLETQDTGKTPVFKRIDISYSNTSQPVSYADGYVIPNKIPMGMDSTFTYIMSYSLNAGHNIKSLAISVPSPAVLNYVYSLSADTLDIDEDLTHTTKDTLYVVLADSLTDSDVSAVDSLYVSFVSKLMGGNHTFDAFLFDTALNDSAGGIKLWENTELGSNSVTASTVLSSILSSVKAIPKVFSPNGDGKNDFTVIEFNLAKVNTDVMIKIFNTAGTLVTSFEQYLVNGSYTVPKEPVLKSEATARTMPGFWDGKDDDGDLVPPGIYIYQVIAETDEGDEVENGTVVVAY